MNLKMKKYYGKKKEIFCKVNKMEFLQSFLQNCGNVTACFGFSDSNISNINILTEIIN